MNPNELLAWAEERREEHFGYLKHLQAPRNRPTNVSRRREAIRHEQDTIKQFELVIDGLRKEVERGESRTTARDGTSTKV